MKKRIDIERLVQWAVRDELPKRGHASKSAWDSISQVGQLGVRVQTSYNPDLFGFGADGPHEDAIRIEQAIRTISNDNQLASLEDAQVILSPWNAIAGDAASLLMMAVFQTQTHIISRGRQANRPVWECDAPLPEQSFVEGMAGRRRRLVNGVDADGDLIELQPRTGGAAKKQLFDLALSPRSPLRWEPSPLTIGEDRAEYFLWQQALVKLAGDLTGELVEHEPLPPSAPAYPWLTGETKSRVLRVAA